MNNHNPYYNVGGISNSELFINRKNETSSILNNIYSGKPQCASITGQRKIGKSSLLSHMMNPVTIKDLGYEPVDHIFVLFDCQEQLYSLNSIDEVYHQLLHQLRLSLSSHTRNDLLPIINPRENDSAVRSWRQALELLARQNIYTIVVYDEFDVAISSKSLLSSGFFVMERGFAHNKEYYAWIASSPLNLSEHFEESYNRLGIPETEREKGSDPEGIAPACSIGLFTKSDVMELVTVPSSNRGVNFTDKEIKSIIKFGGRFPYFIQRACYHFYNAHINNNVNFKFIIERCKNEASSIWENYWKSLNPNQQSLLIDIARERQNISFNSDLYKLVDLSLIYTNSDDDPCFFSDCFREFISEKDQQKKFIIKPTQRIENNRYEIIETIDCTKKSQVVKVKDLRWDKVKTIKFILTDLEKAEKEYLQTALLRESMILYDVNHPNIGRVFDILLDPIAIVMEWIDGISLNKVIKSRTKLTQTEIIKIGIDISDALYYLHVTHKPQIIHRDIKPGNIVLGLQGTAKLIDFGIARDSDVETITKGDSNSTTYVGSPDYSSPEQLQRGEAEPSWDIFSLGVVIYELFTFQKPYKYGNNLSQYQNNQFPKPNPFIIPKDIYEIICTMLDKKPETRPSAEKLKLELKECLMNLGE